MAIQPVVLSEDFLKKKIEQINTPSEKAAQEQYYNLFLMYNGHIRDIIEVAIKREFKNPDTIIDLINRIIPINIVMKIVTKLATVYTEAPSRTVSSQDEIDQKQLDTVVEVMNLDAVQKESNQYFKLYKCNLKEIYLDHKGYPCARNLPRHTYKVWSHNYIQPNLVDLVMIYLQQDIDPKRQILSWWTDSQHWITNGEGAIISHMMQDNPDGINPYGVLPFCYTNDTTLSVDPIFSDDLYRMQIILPLILSDMAFAIKYCAWSIIVVTGDQQGDIPFSPNSILALPFGPEGQAPNVNVVKRDMNIEGVLRFIEFNVAFLLSTMNLSAKTLQSKLESGSVASGVSKMLDEAESIEDKKAQQNVFRMEEKEFFWKMTSYIMPYWRKNKMLNDEVNFEFAKDFELVIHFRDPEVIYSPDQAIELSKKRIDYGFSTLRRELSRLYPGMRDTQLDQLVQEIKAERAEYFGIKQNEQGQLPPGETPEDEDGDELSFEHTHKGTGPAKEISGGHYHEMIDGSGDTSNAQNEGPDHTHVKPDGQQTSKRIG